jgi:hypothetical protein
MVIMVVMVIDVSSGGRVILQQIFKKIRRQGGDWNHLAVVGAQWGALMYMLKAAPLR